MPLRCTCGYRFPFWSVLLVFVSIASAQVTEPNAWRGDWQAATTAAEKYQFAEAVKHASVAMEKGLDHPQSLYQRACWSFRAGKAKDSVRDFDRFLEKMPERNNSLWERGISHYYAGDFKAGAKQFADYQKYHDNDVENAVWRYLCQTKFDGAKKAREAMLPIKNDQRVPMMEIYELFKGNATPTQVLTALSASSSKGNKAKQEAMHAHLYLGLYYDSQGDQAKAREHIKLAVKQFKAGSYMWSAAVVHQQRLAP